MGVLLIMILQTFFELKILSHGLKKTQIIYLFTEESFKKTGARIGKSPMMYEVPQFESIDIDTPDDWDFANVAARHLMKTKDKNNENSGYMSTYAWNDRVIF